MSMYTDPWIRHPADIDMPTTGEYGNYSTYDPVVPVASSSVVAPSSHNVSSAGGRIVMCLSCHRAHASPYSAALRWDPSTIQAGVGPSTDGCFACHSAKDGVP